MLLILFKFVLSPKNRSCSWSRQVPEAALLVNGCEVGLGDIVGECTVARGFQLGAPFGDSEGQGFDLFPSNLLIEAGDQPSSTDGTDGIPSMTLRGSGRASAEARGRSESLRTRYRSSSLTISARGKSDAGGVTHRGPME